MQPVSDVLSTALILTMIVAISMPGAAFVFGICYISIKRKKSAVISYQTIN